MRHLDFGWDPEAFATLEQGGDHQVGRRSWVLARLLLPTVPLKWEGRTIPVGTAILILHPGRSGVRPGFELRTIDMREVFTDLNVIAEPPPGDTLAAGPAIFEKTDSTAERLDVALPWLTHDAWIHHLAPRGLEQYSGGGWGTRDVCQGPVELWLALGRVAPVRNLLLTVFSNQNADGDWPQWFQFFERERHIRPGDSHGDVVFWPLLALAQYLLASDDAAFLELELPFFHAEGAGRAERATTTASSF